MVCEHITYRGRSAVRDASRVLGFSQEQTEKLAALASHSEAADTALALKEGGVAQQDLIQTIVACNCSLM